jgi:hypothetical protein
LKNTGEFGGRYHEIRELIQDQTGPDRRLFEPAVQKCGPVRIVNPVKPRKYHPDICRQSPTLQGGFHLVSDMINRILARKRLF